jgi:hypothetical protein
MGAYQGTQGWPDLNQFVNEAWGWGPEVSQFFPTAVGFVFGTNPPYYLDDFLAVYPKFFGPPSLVSGATLTAGSKTVALVSTTGLGLGQFVVIPGVPKGTVITGIGLGQITISNPAPAAASNIAFNAYETPPIPLAIIQLYLNLAAASLMQARWGQTWLVGMALFIAHYCTLYAKSDAAEVTSLVQSYIHTEAPQGAIPGTAYTLSAAPPSGVLQALYKNGLFLTPGVDYTLSGATVTLTSPTISGDKLQATWPLQMSVETQGVPSTAQLAAQGLMNGILTSKSVGDASASYTVLDEQRGWGTSRTTIYGAQLVDFAKVIGSGPALIW